MDNFRGIILMTLAMALFAVEDMFIKLLADRMSVGQILLVITGFGCAFFAALARLDGQKILSRDALHPALLLRNGGELFGTLCFVTSIALIPLATASAVLQATPLAVTLAAAVFLREQVGWRRWSAIVVGLIGVLIILRPGLEGFDANTLFAVGGVIGLAMRDIGTRMAPECVKGYQLGVWGYGVVIPASLIMMLLSPTPVLMPVAFEWLWFLAAILIGMVAYLAINAAMRSGEIAIVTPFRYSRVLFAILIGMLVFAEYPDGWTIIGAGIVVASGLYTLYREQLRKRESMASPSA